MFLLRKRSVVKFLIAVAMFFLAVACKKDNPINQEERKRKSDSIKKAKKDSITEDSLTKIQLKYSAFIFPKKNRDSAMSEFLQKYSKDEQYTILAINRLDHKNQWRADTLAIPDKIDSTLMMYSPFPANVNVLKEVKKFVFFSYPIQAYAVYSNGNLLKWGPTSMGKKASQTERGLHFSNWKKELSISSVDSEWKLPYNFNIQNKLGIGWHQYDLPGFPASHSCLRLLLEDAKWMYNYADQWILNKCGATVKANGTPVIVHGDFDWNGQKPWKKLISNPKANDISEKDLEEIIKPNLDKILKEQKNREEVLREIEAEKLAEQNSTS